MKFKIVADSSADLLTIPYDTPFASVPLKIITTEREYVDDEALDVHSMLADLRKYNGKSRSSCPNPGEYLEAFGDAENVFCITITSGLSGSYNSAVKAANDYKALHNGRNVMVIDSLSTGAESALMVEKIAELITLGKEFSEIEAELNEYVKRTNLLFSLESLHNLAANGRVNPIVAKLSGLLGIRVVGKASDVGTLEVLEKARGAQNAVLTVVKLMKAEGYSGGKVRIHHAENLTAAEKIRDAVLADFPEAKIEISETRALCSFYAELGGVLIGYES